MAMELSDFGGLLVTLRPDLHRLQANGEASGQRKSSSSHVSEGGQRKTNEDNSFLSGRPSTKCPSMKRTKLEKETQ
ncbi:hypothetical protein NPIL_684231 [Nephila pilipes]|uniref:Uncharacterized protein n=1 Tax=Nephila pilipes TaxID=299642 RepID=A0A8X6T897_NEPPI|nr:hypothetical protein NPIL_684231 [Nephila pilipes]